MCGFLFVRINLAHSHTRTRKNELQNTVLLSIHCNTCVCVFQSMCYLCRVKYLQPKFATTTTTTTKKFHRDKMANFIFKPKLNGISPVDSTLLQKFLPEILWKCASFFAWNVFHAMFHFTFFLCKLFEKRTKKKVPKRIQMYTNDLPNVTVHFHWRMHAYTM